MFLDVIAYKPTNVWTALAMAMLRQTAQSETATSP